MKKMTEKENKMFVKETERAIQLKMVLKTKENELHTMQKDIEKACWRRDVLRLRRNIEEYANTIFSWKEEFLASEIGKKLCELGEGHVWLRHYPNKTCRVFQDGTIEVALIRFARRELGKTKSTHLALKPSDITKTALDPCDKEEVNVARLYEEIALEIMCGKIYDAILSNYREWPAYLTEYY